MIEDGTRVVVTSSGLTGTVVGFEHIHGDPDDLWSEKQYLIALDDHPLEQSVGEAGLALEDDYLKQLTAEQKQGEPE